MQDAEETRLPVASLVFRMQGEQGLKGRGGTRLVGNNRQLLSGRQSDQSTFSQDC